MLIPLINKPDSDSKLFVNSGELSAASFFKSTSEYILSIGEIHKVEGDTVKEFKNNIKNFESLIQLSCKEIAFVNPNEIVSISFMLGEVTYLLKSKAKLVVHYTDDEKFNKDFESFGFYKSLKK